MAICRTSPSGCLRRSAIVGRACSLAGTGVVRTCFAHWRAGVAVVHGSSVKDKEEKRDCNTSRKHPSLWAPVLMPCLLLSSRPLTYCILCHLLLFPLLAQRDHTLRSPGSGRGVAQLPQAGCRLLPLRQALAQAHLMSWQQPAQQGTRGNWQGDWD